MTTCEKCGKEYDEKVLTHYCVDSNQAYICHKMFADEAMLRDFFAAMAMQKLIDWKVDPATFDWRGISEDRVSYAAYLIADAMLAARKK